MDPQLINKSLRKYPAELGVMLKAKFVEAMRLLWDVVVDAWTNLASTRMEGSVMMFLSNPSAVRLSNVPFIDGDEEFFIEFGANKM